MVKRIDVTVTDPVGLYATPATELVDTMKMFNSDIKLVYASKTVNMKSLMGVLSLRYSKQKQKLKLLLMEKMRTQLLNGPLN